MTISSTEWGLVWPVALASAIVFGGIVLMSNRPRGATLAQAVLAIAGVLIFVAIAAPSGIAGVSQRGLAGFATGLIAASIAAMLYHFYLGRFEQVWAARGVFAALFLALSLILGLVFLALL